MSRKQEKNGAETTADSIARIGSNPVVNTVAAACSIVSLPVSFFSQSVIARVTAAAVICIVLVVFICKLLSYKSAEKKAEAKYRKNLDSILDKIKNYNIYYKEIITNINCGSINNNNTLDISLARLTTCIERLMSEFLCEDVCVCIKMIETESLMDENHSEWKLKTIARSNSTKGKRKVKDSKSVLVSENSDFRYIIDGRIEYFAMNNLSELNNAFKATGNEYKNSNPNYLQEYKSTIVHPIRINTENVSEIIRENNFNVCSEKYHFHVIGFLCLDSQKIFNKESQLFYADAADLMGSFAENLYPLLESYVVAQLQGIPSKN